MTSNRASALSLIALTTPRAALRGDINTDFATVFEPCSMSVPRGVLGVRGVAEASGRVEVVMSKCDIAGT